MAKSKTITCYVCSNEMKESEAQYNSVDPNELQPICPKCVAEHPFLVDEMNNHESPVVNIIQRYAGLNSKNCPALMPILEGVRNDASAAWSAAWSALLSTTNELQASVLLLVEKMIGAK